MRLRLSAVIVLAIASFIAMSCGGGSVSDGATGPVTPVDTTKPITTVQRASLTVRVSIDPTDVLLANSAGISTRGITVRISRATAGFTPQTATTGADGSVRFDNLLDGNYQVSADRTLSATELSRLVPADRDASLFAGGSSAVVSPPVNATATIAMVANRRGSVIISEMFPFNNPLTTTLGYGMGDYIELYNNSDTTIYLDGMLVFRTSLSLHVSWPQYPCNQYNAAERNDSTTLYANLIHQIPGNGRDYPILPGEAKVLAQDAMDHNAAAPGLQQLDLSGAAFEQIGSDADIDNPFVPNLIRVQAGTGVFGRGYPFNGSWIAHGIALPGARAAIAVAPLVNTLGTAPATGTLFDSYRIPRQYVLDVMSVASSPDEPGYDVAFAQVLHCTPFISPVFDRGLVPLVNTRRSIAISRKSLGFNASGHEILQRTRTSSRDFEYHEPLLRSLKKH